MSGNIQQVKHSLLVLCGSVQHLHGRLETVIVEKEGPVAVAISISSQACPLAESSCECEHLKDSLSCFPFLHYLFHVFPHLFITHLPRV